LFSRQQRSGWHVYGNDIDKFGNEEDDGIPDQC
jgi:N6-adenosine-specific RNA methylase IME4